MSWTMMGSSGAVGPRERALRTLYDEQAGALYGYVVRLLGGDRHRAEDVVQETLLRCWRTQDLDIGRPLRPWLFRVARNLVIDDYRSRMTRPQEIGAGPWLDDALTRPDGVDRLLSSLLLKEAFRQLSAKHREVLYEAYYSGRSTRETGQLLGIPPGTVKSRTHHAVRALRLAMGVTESADAEVGREPSGAREAQRTTSASRPTSWMSASAGMKMSSPTLSSALRRIRTQASSSQSWSTNFSRSDRRTAPDRRSRRLEESEAVITERAGGPWPVGVLPPGREGAPPRAWCGLYCSTSSTVLFQ
ncbi:sigma-70 family RNA polymerase sigma factor [Streptomyces iranensis]|uniref:RNA polymerase sigma factor (Sigma-70 family) n=1 Tax=Streptomyces iranensis TaxID=576784 RepID=A0A060ZMQ0_9ACTN|nr:sigma-70 family RNA polymerase sigma factor [Streptomyces iranensis]MBP2062328.1 RNA polymerase sigma factor (sigma-70 family) [Streptomyces iranensis]CDR07472.1 RNA polymerase sigma factor SigL [Streptomyces iranensis]